MGDGGSVEDPGLLDARASLRALMSFPRAADADYCALWRAAAMGLEDCREFSEAQPGQELRVTAGFLSTFAEQLLVAGKMLSIAARRYAVCVQVGASLRRLLDETEQSGVDDAPAPLRSPISAMAFEARAIAMGEMRRKIEASGRRNELEGVSSRRKNWAAYASVAHFCAAHLEFRRCDLIGWPGAVALPCDATSFRSFLQRAEELRRAACARQILHAERMLRIEEVIPQLRCTESGNAKSTLRAPDAPRSMVS